MKNWAWQRLFGIDRDQQNRLIIAKSFFTNTSNYPKVDNSSDKCDFRSPQQREQMYCFPKEQLYLVIQQN
jgi:hypothetical protein